MSRETTDLIIINGYAIPAPDEGYSINEYTILDSARDSNGVLRGQQIGDTQWKIEGLQWSNLTPEEWKALKTAIKPFYVPVTFTNDENERMTLTMYPGDRQSEP